MFFKVESGRNPRWPTTAKVMEQCSQVIEFAMTKYSFSQKTINDCNRLSD